MKHSSGYTPLCSRWFARAAAFLLIAFAAPADEGMWTLNNFPKQLVEKRYGFTPSDAWLDHLRLSSVRFNNGGSDPSPARRD